MVILQRLQAKGYTGGASILRMHLRKIRGPRKKPVACIRFESPPGQQCQCDWGTFWNADLWQHQTQAQLYGRYRMPVPAAVCSSLLTAWT